MLDKRPSFRYYSGALRATAQNAEPNMERWLSWSKAHDWKSCNVSKAFWGSNPHLSARNPKPYGFGFFVFFSASLFRLDFCPLFRYAE